ncbi:MAG: oxygen-independent coproporphyrinogen III oxidase [Gammaproteobacteria bacterium]|nr:oxygen-independent coproporphyrinogen III oxidase [Gammaproteobacteria bacterium]
MDQTLVFDSELIKRYDVSGPRYTSYPTAVQFHEGFGTQQYREIALASNNAEEGVTPLSLYFHLPFCDTVCFFCGCNKVVTKDRNRAAPYLERLHREIEMQAQLFDNNRPVNQLHWGGGTPTFISHDQMIELMRVTGEHFQLLDNDEGEYSLEVDPREIRTETIACLRSIGFNRISMGVQDFDPAVQKAVNRIQSEKETEAVIVTAREEGFKSVSMDLMYGLPMQTVQTFSQTLERVIDLSPDRLSVFNYAHLPELFKPQRRINEVDLPVPGEKLEILQLTIERLLAAGYVYIGMDHFARPDDEMAIAQREGTLYRNFQGYSTHADCDMVSMGVTAISKVGSSYSQNQRVMDQYIADIDADQLAIFRGVELDSDDLLRREVINQLICHFELDIKVIEQQYQIVFAQYFATALKALVDMERDGLLQLSETRIVVQPAGRLLIRNICMVFDRYMENSGKRFSKVI